MRRRPKPSHKRARSARITGEQISNSIPAGPSNPHRKRRGAIATEPREFSKAGNPVVWGEVVSTPVRKLYEAGAITWEEEQAARRFQGDYEIAYASSQNTLAAVQVDGGSKGGGDGTDTRLFHASRFRAAEIYLCELAVYAQAAILCDPGCGIEPSYTGIGRQRFPRATQRSQRDAGRTIVQIICERLALFYARASQPGRKSCAKPEQELTRRA